MAAKTAEQILTFVYEGTDRRGQKVKGEVNGKNMALAKAQLRKQGINANKVYRMKCHAVLWIIFKATSCYSKITL